MQEAAPRTPFSFLARKTTPAQTAAPHPLARPGQPGETTKTQLSDEQQAVLACKSDIIVVNSFAGTGKTTTANEFTKSRPGERFIYLCLNKANQMEAQRRFGPNVQARTTHALALSAMRSLVGSRVTNVWRPKTLMDEVNINSQRIAALTHAVLLEFFKSEASKPDERHTEALQEKWRASEVERRHALTFARFCWEQMNKPGAAISIPHDAYLKMFALTRPHIDADWIVFDEAQDANPVTAQIIHGQSKNTKILCIGDRHQSIYGFRGAVNAMEDFANLDGAATLNLTKTWRFGPDIAKLASTVLSLFKDEKNQIQGMREAGPCPHPTSAKLSRTNAQLFAEAVALRDSPIHWLGGIDNYNVNKLVDATHLWGGRLQSVEDKFLQGFNSWDEFKSYGDTTRDAEVRVLCQIVEDFGAETPKLVDQLRANAVNDPDRTDAVVLTTAHKSKGLDWDNVQLCNDFSAAGDAEAIVQSAPSLPLDPETSQEINLLYVAMTRARRHLSLDGDTSDWFKNLAAHQQSRKLALARLPDGRHAKPPRGGPHP